MKIDLIWVVVIAVVVWYWSADNTRRRVAETAALLHPHGGGTP
jgi:hypothetical protein